jgi:glutamate synthase domain-containing protein 3
MRINAKGMHYRELNELIHQAVGDQKKEIILDNVNGQRYIGGGLSGNVKITVNGTPGNDLAAFMDGPTIVVNSNAQDGIGNTMNAGKIIVCGSAGDIVGHSMRGGNIFVKGNVGYRVGIHMKAYRDLCPVVIAGGCAGDFLGEYMAGGLIIILGLSQNKKNRYENQSIVGNYVGTGMHGGAIYIRGNIEKYQLGREVALTELNREDVGEIREHLKEYCSAFSLNFQNIIKAGFVKLAPQSSRPYGRLYAY